MKKPTPHKKVTSFVHANKFIAIGVALVTVASGYLLLNTRAAGYYASADPENGTRSGNVQVLNDSSAYGGMAVQFTAPVTTPSTTTPPSTTPSKTITNCMTKLDQCGYPSKNTTGASAGDPTVSCMSVNTSQTIKHVKIVGPCAAGIAVKGGTVHIEDVTIDCVNYWGTGLIGSNFTAVRTQINRCENGADVAGGNITIADSYISDINEKQGQHADGIQAYTDGKVMSNVTVRHNTFDLSNPITSSLIWGFPGENLLVEDNFFSGGGFTIYCPANPPVTNVIYRNNRFYGPVTGADHPGQGPMWGYTDSCNNPGHITWTGNFLDYNLATLGP